MKRIGIIPNIKKDKNFTYTSSLVRTLMGRAKIYMESAYSGMGFEATYTDDIYHCIDILIVLGGDGTILQIAEPCAKYNIPILGINLGRVGFMSEIETDRIDHAMRQLLNDNYVLEQRMMLHIEYYSDHILQKSYYALNDVVLSKPSETTLISCSVYANEEKVNSYIADGIIVATPTGSTGYSLSAEGPVADPCTNLFIVTPICAHRLSARSVVLSTDKKIVLRPEQSDNGKMIVSIDGKCRIHISSEDEIVVTKSEYTAKIIKIGQQSFYDTLVKKLS